LLASVATVHLYTGLIIPEAINPFIFLTGLDARSLLLGTDSRAHADSNNIAHAAALAGTNRKLYIFFFFYIFSFFSPKTFLSTEASVLGKFSLNRLHLLFSCFLETCTFR
jgi:hypothetical protein